MTADRRATIRPSAVGGLFSKSMAVKSTRWLRMAIWLVLVAAALVLSLILAGLFDPKPFGPAIWSDKPGLLNVATGARHLEWLEEAPPLPESYTLRLTAVYVVGELDSGYGLVTGDSESGTQIIVAISPLGYVTIRDGSETLLPWQPWPHVHTGNLVNEISLDVRPEGTGTQVTVRVNRELLWTGQTASPASRAGLLLETAGGGTTVDFRLVELFAP